MGSQKRRRKGRFVGIPYQVVSSSNYVSLSAKAVKLIVDLSYQYNGSNNGSLSACWTLMRDRGWKSTSVLYNALKELQGRRLVVVTRRGWKQRGRPTMLALTWHGIDEAKFEYDQGVFVSNVPLGYWKDEVRDKEKEPRLSLVGREHSNFSTLYKSG